jgi:ATP-dependent DNA helicase RecQ
MRWAEGGSCRHDAILRYFGDEAETLDGCGHCDVCEALPAGPEAAEGATLVVRKALSAVARIHRQFGLQAAVHLLRGTEDPRLTRSGLDRTPTFGALRERSDAWLMQLLRRCVTAGWVDLTPGDRPLALLTDAGRAVMKAERPARVLLPPDGARERRSPAGPRARTRKGRVEAEELGGGDAALFEALRGHRLDVARREGVPPYVVASDRTLRELALIGPRTRSELLAVYGIGDTKADRYGDGFLQVVARHRSA